MSQQRFLCRNKQLNKQQESEKKSLSRPRSFLSGQKFIMTQEILSRQRKLYRDRVDKLKRKMFIVTRKIVSRQIPEAEGHEKLVTNRFGVVTQGIPVATRTRLLHQNFVATLSKSVVT